MDKPDPTPLLSAEEERDLARAIEAGVVARHLLATGERPIPATAEELDVVARLGEQAWNRFLLANVRLVWRLAGREARQAGLPADDLFQEGFVALAGALQRYDPDMSRFSTFATIRVRQHLAAVAAARLGELALPPSRALRLRRARGIAGAVGQERGRTLDAVELAAALGRTADWTRSLLGYRAPKIVDTADEALAIPDPSPVDLDAGIYADQVRRVLRRLDEDQARVLSLRYGFATGEPLDVRRIAARLALSPSTVRRLEVSGLAALRGFWWLLDPDRTSLAG